MEFKSITILSTVKNIKSTARPWLDSLVTQEYNGKFNIVIIDSNSIDGTKEILQEYSEKISFIKVVEYESSQPAAFNYAINNKLLSGELVALIDGDCVAPNNWLKLLTEALEKNNVDAIGGPGLTPNNSNIIQQLIGYDLDMRFLSIPRGPVKRHPNMNLLIKKEILSEIGFNEELPIGYDADFCYRLNQKGYILWYEPSAFVWHYHRASLNKYAKQQFQNAKYALFLYKFRKSAMRGDNINPPNMILQPLIFILFIIFLPIGLTSTKLFLMPIALFLILLVLFTIDIAKAFKVRPTIYVSLLYFIYTIRLIFWIFGGINGMVNINEKHIS